MGPSTFKQSTSTVNFIKYAQVISINQKVIKYNTNTLKCVLNKYYQGSR